MPRQTVAPGDANAREGIVETESVSVRIEDDVLDNGDGRAAGAGAADASAASGTDGGDGMKRGEKTMMKKKDRDEESEQLDESEGIADLERGDTASTAPNAEPRPPPPPPFVPVWRVWPGKNRIACAGRIFMGSHLIGPFVTLGLIALPSGAYLSAVLPALRGDPAFVPLIAMNLTLLAAALIFMYRTVCADPGIIPRRRLPAGLTRSSFSTVPRFIKDKVRTPPNRHKPEACTAPPRECPALPCPAATSH